MSETLPIVVGGTVAIDNVKTPEAEHQDLLGGSASFASLAASFFAKPVHLVGIVGKDFPSEHLEMLAGKGIEQGSLEHSEGASFTWTGEYFNSMNDRKTHTVALNVLENWSVKVPGKAAESPIVVAANMSPVNQMQMIEACTAADKFVLIDTMDLWIEIANDALHEVLKKADLLVINESEAREFAQTSNLIKAGKILREKGPRYVIIKLGEFGAVLFGPPEDNHGIFRCNAFPLEEVADPTGAGDSFLGGLAGYLASLGKTEFSFSELRDGVVRGTVLASYTCEDFSTRRLEKLDEAELNRRLQLFREMSCW
ncbi:PfkB family carbohydrate kinase [Roseibacillus ishigakijimensis]|uniref:Carbohydrate kinase n=1 Tax=Roseibacillus ishigakijimensis TaxID=454146 RepID=A0A934RSB5_9BACT|nr:PfkB family carbohydrate kinase [Roseibacillus ishigakijimensis]MBK1834553.1 carbohydrate kinase [Roseibacillus ishigakijimensis]